MKLEAMSKVSKNVLKPCIYSTNSSCGYPHYNVYLLRKVWRYQKGNQAFDNCKEHHEVSSVICTFEKSL
jgi:hypothetical protein